MKQIEYIFNNFTDYNLIERIKGNIGCPFYVFQKNTTYIPTTKYAAKKNPVDKIIVNKIKIFLDNYDYWFNDENMYKYID